MTVSLTALKKHRLFKGLAFGVVSLLLTGQFFNCCFINESFASAVERAFRPTHPAQGGTGAAHNGNTGAAVAAEADDDADAHPQCHGHGSAMHTERNDLEACAFPGDRKFNPDRHCLSEQSFSGKPMLSGDIADAHAALPATLERIETSVPARFKFAQPRPRNKSSPPLYLLTLRILV
ncbi:MAG: hypothetical protein ABI036_00765 [Fibrobacteria bacterium]